MASGMQEFTLRADPEKIQTTAGNLKKQIDVLKADFDDIIAKVESTVYYWKGDAADAYRKDFKNEQPDFSEAFDRLSEHVVDLYNIAAVYTGAEQMSQNLAESLPTNVIE